MDITIETIEANRDKIIAAMKDAERLSYLHPSCEYRVYIDTDGAIDSEEWVAGDNGYLQFRDGYSRTYVGTFCNQHYSILWDYWFVNGFSDFASEFESRFGIELHDSEDFDGMSMEEIGKAVAVANNIPRSEYLAWLDDETEEAIAEAISVSEGERTYDNMLDDSIKGMEEYEAWLSEKD